MAEIGSSSDCYVLIHCDVDNIVATGGGAQVNIPVPSSGTRHTRLEPCIVGLSDKGLLPKGNFMKFKVVLDGGIYSWYLVDDNKEIIASCPVLGMYPKSAILAQIKRVQSAHRATIDDSTPADPPKPPPYVPSIYDRD